MSNLMSLIKIIFKNSFRGEGKKKSRMSSLAGVFLSGGIFGLMFIFYTIFAAPLFNQQGMGAEFLALLFLASQVVILLFGTVLMINIMFFSKDAEFMLYLPVKPVTIFLAKITYVYLSELMLSAFMLGVSAITFGIVCAMPFYFYLLLLPALLIVPMVPLIISSLLCLPIMYIISFFKNKSILGTVLLTVMFGALMFGYMSFFGNLGNSDNIDLPFESIRQTVGYMLPNIALARLITLTSANYLTDLLYVFIFTAGLFSLTLIITRFTYKKSVASQLETRSEKTVKELSYQTKSPLKSFLIKDAREIIRNTGFAFYCIFQVVLAPIMLIFFGVMISSEAEIQESIIVLQGTGLMMTTMLVAGMNYVAMSSISREGVNFNMSKTLPAPYRFQIRAKLLLADIVLVAGLVFSFIPLVFMLKFNVINAILYAGFAFILGNGINKLLLYLDAKNPKLDWESITMAIKNSKAAFVSMLISMFIGILLIVGLVIIEFVLPSGIKIIGYAGYWVVFYAVAIVLNYAFTKLCNNNVERLVAQYEN